ncbi:unnamed protein product, partial [Rotaria sp. Silwood1]
MVISPYRASFSDTPSACQTAGDPSTILLRHGGCPACSASHPFTESHSSTTIAVVVLPLPLM